METECTRQVCGKEPPRYQEEKLVGQLADLIWEECLLQLFRHSFHLFGGPLKVSNRARTNKRRNLGRNAKPLIKRA